MGSRSLLILTYIIILNFQSAEAARCHELIRRFNITSWNIENHFDWVKDHGKRDDAFLPKKLRKQLGIVNDGEAYDWTKKSFDLKLKQIAKVILPHSSVSLPRRPDILGLIEIENAQTAHRTALKLGYEGMDLTHSPDERGIDVAVLYSDRPGIVQTRREEHRINAPQFKNKPTRNILELVFRVNDKYDLHVFVNHWPSQGAPASARMITARRLMGLVLKRERENPEARIIALGDFNTIDSDDPNPFKDALLSKHHGPQRLFDVEQVFRKRFQDEIPDALSIAPGTYNYKGAWNSLDRFFVNRKLLATEGLRVDVRSFRIHNPRGLSIKRDGQLVPKSYRHNEKRESHVGFSDHYAISVDLVVD